MKIRVTKQFKDIQNDVMRIPGEIYDATKKRAEQLIKLGYCKEVKPKIETAELRRKYETGTIQDKGMEEDQETDIN